MGKLSDRFGRRAFFLIGPLVNVAVSLLQLRYQRSIAVAYVQRVLGQTFSTISGNENPCESCHPPAVNVGRLHVALTPPRGRRLHVV